MQPKWILYNMILAYNYDTKLIERDRRNIEKINKEFEIREAWGATVLIFIINILVSLAGFWIQQIYMHI